MFIKINGKQHCLSGGRLIRGSNILDILVQKSRAKPAAKRFFRKLLKALQYIPRVIVTDKLGSYRAAKEEVMPRARTSPTQRLEQPS